MSTTVLFVDDEANVLSGLRRMLRGQRNHWNMHFANGGVEALELLEKCPVDVIVSDMRMPGIDGAELLTRVSKQYPNTVRLILSGQSDQEKIFRAIGPAHQFMSKPCDPDVLIKTIERACHLHERLEDKALQELIAKIDGLPSLPQVYTDLVTELNSQDASVDKVAEIIGRDLGMTSKVLHLVNSSFFGIPQRVTCVKHAASMLGLSIIRPLTLSVSAFSQYKDPGVRGYSLEREIEHGLSVGVSARQIASSRTSDPTFVDDAFLAGMLHDIGKLILAVHCTKSLQEAIDTSQTKHVPLWKAELEVLGTTHAAIGAHLLELWGLPNPIVEAVAFHHQPELSMHDEFTPLAAVYVSNFCESELQPDRNPDEFAVSYIQRLSLSEQVELCRANRILEPKS
ncbi:MAG: response regulator [Pirellulaceae bacterium]